MAAIGLSREPREVLDGILWILRTGARWQDLSERYPPYQTCHRTFQKWVQNGVFPTILETLAEDLGQRGGLGLSECFINGTFVPAKKGALCWENQAWQRDQDHGHCRRPWFTSRHSPGKRFATRNHPC